MNYGWSQCPHILTLCVFGIGVLVVMKVRWRLLKKQNRGGAHKPDGTLNGVRALNRIIKVICIFIILYIMRSIIIVNYHYHHRYFLYHDHNFI